MIGKAEKVRTQIMYDAGGVNRVIVAEMRKAGKRGGS